MPKNQRVGAGDGPVKLTGCLQSYRGYAPTADPPCGPRSPAEEEDHLRFLSPSIDGPRGAVITGGGPVCADGFCCPGGAISDSPEVAPAATAPKARPAMIAIAARN